MDSSDIILDFLHKCGIDFEVFGHEPIFTLEAGEQIARKIGIEPCKCLLLTNRKHQYFMLVSQGEESVSLKDIATVIGSSRLSFASTESLSRLLRSLPGSVSPLELIFDEDLAVKLVFDGRVLKSDMLLLAPGVNDRSVIIRTSDFLNVFLPGTRHTDYLVIDER